MSTELGALALQGPCELVPARKDGYGTSRWYGVTVGAHVAAWERAHGPIPVGLFVCHRCDVRNCIRPEHLFLGSAADNNADRTLKAHRETGRTWQTKAAALAELFGASGE